MMERENLIPVNEFCAFHRITYNFISNLSDAGLIELIIIEDSQYLQQDAIQDIEKLVRLHTELDINPEGIEAITHLLHRMHMMQQQIQVLQQKLDLYEEQ